MARFEKILCVRQEGEVTGSSGHPRALVTGSGGARREGKVASTGDLGG